MSSQRFHLTVIKSYLDSRLLLVPSSARVSASDRIQKSYVHIWQLFSSERELVGTSAGGYFSGTGRHNLAAQ
jgi:hypothetical protein